MACSGTGGLEIQAGRNDRRYCRATSEWSRCLPADKRNVSAVKVIFLTVNNDAEIAAEAFRRGASGYLVKTCASSELVTAVRNVLRGGTYLSSTLSNDTVDFFRRQHAEFVKEGERLTERQREVLQLFAEGRTMKEVGDILDMTTRTVAFHKYRIMEVLDAKSNADLVRYAVRKHLIAA